MNGIEIQLLSGDVGLEQISQPEFLFQWKNILDKCPWSSVFQSPQYILQWYNVYKHTYLPIILFGKIDEDIIGILFLSVEKESFSFLKSKSGYKFVPAGNYFSIEQTWIIRDETYFEFLEFSIQKIFSIFPNSKINFRYLPSPIPISSFFYNKFFRENSVIEKFVNPLLNFEIPFEEIFKKRHLKAKFNRLQKAGNVDFYRVNDFEEFLDTLNKIEIYLEIRQGAIFNKKPFINDPLQKQVLLDWFNLNLLHVSILKLDNIIIGTVIMMIDGERNLHLAGLISYSPLHSRFSPGLVHLFLLGQMVKEEGFMQIKLSPGYDIYKDRFSNDSEIVYEVLICKNSFKRNTRKLRIEFHRQLLKRGIRPMDIQVKVNKQKVFLKKRMQNCMEFFKSPIDKISNKKNPLNPEKENVSKFNVNRLEDLVLFNEEKFKITRWEFLEDALKRFDKGQEFLTIIKNNELVACIWLSKVELENIDNIDLNRLNENNIILKYYLSY